MTKLSVCGVNCSTDCRDYGIECEGCIALKNSDMREVWSLVKDGTLIEIRP